MNDDLIDRSDDPQLGRSLGLSRRQLLAATTGMAAAAALGAAAFGAGSPAHAATRAAVPGAVKAAGNGVLLPPGKRGIILYTVRDAISRDPNTTDLRVRLQGGLPGALPHRVQADRVRGLQPARERRGRQRQQRRRRAAAARVARRQRARGRGQPRLRSPGRSPTPRSRHSTRSARSRTSSGSATSARAATPPAARTSPTGSSQPIGGTSSASARPATGSSCTRTTTTSRTASCSTAARSTRWAARRAPAASAASSTSWRTPTRATCTSRWTSTGRTSRSTSTRRFTAPDGTSVDEPLRPGRRRGGADHPVPALPHEGRQEGHDAANGYVMAAVRHWRHRLHDVLPAHRCQGLPQRDVGAGHRARRLRPTPASRSAFAQVSYDGMAELRG